MTATGSVQIHIQSTSNPGQFYAVRYSFRDKSWHCECRGFFSHKWCRHLYIAINTIGEIADEAKADLGWQREMKLESEPPEENEGA